MSALFAAGLSGCTNDGLEDNTVKNPVQTGDEIIFGSRLSGDAETRTVYGDRSEKGVPVYWEADGSDQIAIYCLQSSAPANHLVDYKVTPVMNGEDPTATAESVVKVNAAEAGLQWGDRNTLHNFYAFYPASAVKGTAEENATGMITANIPVTQQVQEWREGTMETKDPAFKNKKTYFGLPNMDYAYMYAYTQVDPSKIDEKTPVNLAFKNLVTVLDITVQGPASGTATITNINVSAVDGTQPILTGDFTCNIRAARDVTATCEPVGNFSEERSTISIPCYDKKEGKFIQLGQDELLNVKAYIIPQDVNNTVTPQTLQITVSVLNGAACKKTLNTAAVTPHKINRVILPKLQVGETNYWMSSLDPDIYVSELSLPGSKMSYLTKANGADVVYQNAAIGDQLLDGVRAFIFQVQRRSNGELRISVDGEALDVTLSKALEEIANFLADAEDKGKKQEAAFVLVTYISGSGSQQAWMKSLQNTVNACAKDPLYRIFTGEMTPNVTLGDVAGKIILKANYNSEDMINGVGTAPMMYTIWTTPYVPGGLPMTWGNPNNAANLTWLYQEVTTVLDTDRNENGSFEAEATKAQKEEYIKAIFQGSVDAYKNDTSHKTWFMNDLGGYYNYQTREYVGLIPYWQEHKDPQGLATDMNNLGVSELQNRTENASLGLVYMNFADMDANSGALYKSDWLIQTVIDNNFKFALRKAGGTSGTTAANYDAGYSNGGNAIGWDK